MTTNEERLEQAHEAILAVAKAMEPIVEAFRQIIRHLGSWSRQWTPYVARIMYRNRRQLGWRRDDYARWLGWTPRDYRLFERKRLLV